jgi:hypothetical protein
MTFIGRATAEANYFIATILTPGQQIDERIFRDRPERECNKASTVVKYPNGHLQLKVRTFM